jgi:hypothetical protein
MISPGIAPGISSPARLIYPIKGRWVAYWDADNGVALDGSQNVTGWTSREGGLVLSVVAGAATNPVSAVVGGRKVIDCGNTGILQVINDACAIAGPVVVVYSGAFGLTANTVFVALGKNSGAGNRAIYSYGNPAGTALETFRDSGAEASKAGISAGAWVRCGSIYDGTNVVSVLPATSAALAATSTLAPNSLTIGGYQGSSISRAKIRQIGFYVPVVTGAALIAEVQSILALFANR